MPLLRVQFPLDEFFIILLDIPGAGFLQQIVPVIHLNTKRIQGIDHFLGIGNDGFILTRQFGEKVLLNTTINTQLHFLRIDQHQL